MTVFTNGWHKSFSKGVVFKRNDSINFLKRNCFFHSMRKISILLVSLLILFAACSSAAPTKCYLRIGDENVVEEMKVGTTNTVKALNVEENKQYPHRLMLVVVTQDSCEFAVDNELLFVQKNTTESKYDVKIKVVGVG